ncbi:MFS transporter, CP family, cyanate transporter [Gracilibacillus ureilyticus]|uniref:MFS transporter, CP family, cyanate transporter n=1 Tax=Gracilibacillus ureilyticus TaxID=531814 RepID=A0A1H9NLD6_9BACI|nr:MFS transporter [Gracilibacillus ureilyticus]SER36750.1 MFS transporter, CP family, cyanate transporter [Gracilibacillus ureilyticus]
MPTNEKWKYSIFITGIIVLAFNLRPAITSVGPIIGIIRDELNLDNWNVGLITSLPLLAFAFMSPIAPRIANRAGNERALLYGLIILLSGIVIRSAGPIIFLYIGTTLAGVGIAIINVILPSLIKGSFPAKIGLMTGLYTTSMSIFAAFGSGLSVPLTVNYGLGWKLSLASWSIITVIGIIIWLIAIKNSPAQHEVKLYEPSGKKLIRSGIAWQVTLFMGLQSFLFYVTISWLAEILKAKGYDVATAGWFVAYMQLISLPATFLTPIIAGKLKDQKPVVYGFGLCALIGYTGLFFNPSIIITTVWVTLIGIALGASISLALALLGLRTENARQAGELSGMAQSFGYLLASAGPIFIGFLFDLSGKWNSSILIILMMTIVMIIFGIGASRNKYVL